MKVIFGVVLLSFVYKISVAQIDTTYLIDPSAPYGSLDITIAKSASDYYFLEEGKTFSFREKDGVRTQTYLDMTAWESERYQQGNMRRRTNGSDTFVMNYRYLKPQKYDKDYAGGYPLVILLHGLSERGNCAGSNCYHSNTTYSPNENNPVAPSSADSKLLNNDYNLAHGGANYLEAHDMNGDHQPGDAALPARGFPGFVVFPQNLNGWDGTSAEDAIRLVRLFIKRYNIDVNRIYINGVSNGGHGAFEILKRAPWLFASAILFSPADDGGIISQNLQSSISDVPLWIFQGGIDKKPLAKDTEAYIRKLRNAGANIRYTLYPELGHGTWNKAFAEPDFFSWMLGQTQSQIHVFANNPVICATNGKGATLSLPKGFSNYEWELNGQSIPAATENIIVAEQPGVYRGAFYNYNGNRIWSQTVTVSQKNMVPPQLVQHTTLLLTDPNESNEAILSANEIHDRYYWYKDGKRLDFNGNEDDTLHTAILPHEFGDGVYTLVVSDFDGCISPASEGKRIYFDDRAKVSLTSPTELRLEALAPSEINLSWNDTNDSESGFEIWARPSGNVDDSMWKLVAIPLANQNSFRSTGLIPYTSYEYMIRAINSDSRSPYTMPVTITTPNDQHAPSAPGDLRARIQSADQIKLSWDLSSDNSAIGEYLIYLNEDTIETNSADTTFIITPYTVNTDYVISVRAKDLGGNLSEHSNEVSMRTNITGLFYQHTTGDWNSLETIDWSVKEFEGWLDSFTLNPKTQDDFFNFRFDGYLLIEEDGVYQFRISSDDGSRLVLDDSVLIINDGIHNLVTVTAPIQLLSTGPHRITVDFFDNTSSDSLLVEYKGRDTGGEWTAIPKEKLASEYAAPAEEMASENLAFTVYPNPLKDQTLNLKLSGGSTGPILISMHSSTGREIFTKSIDVKSADVPLVEWPVPENGLYLVKITQGSKSATQKLIINR